MIDQARRKIAEIWRLVNSVVGPNVLKIAQRIERARISINGFHGKLNLLSWFRNKSICNFIVQPTKTPIRTPRKLAENTKIIAS